MSVHLVSVLGGYLKVVPHMLAHSRARGVDSFFLPLHIKSEDDPLREEAEALARDFGVGIHETFVGPWHEDLNREIYRGVRAKYPNDWFVLADLDELQVYPEAIEEVVKYCDRRGYDYVEGCFLDRIAADGSFPPVTGGSIWEQYPLAGFVSYPLLKATPNKVVLTKGWVDIRPGQHSAADGTGCPDSEFYAQVHHFKWVGTIAERLARRAAMYESGEWQTVYDETRQQACTFVEYYNAHGGRLDVNDESFYLAPSDDDYHSYKHWEAVRNIVRNSGHFW